RVRVGTASAISDSDGTFRVWDIVPFEPVTVAVDSLSLPSPLLVPAFASARVEPGPNRFRGINIPSVQAGVIEGRVVRPAAEGRRLEGVGGVMLVLTDARTGATRRFSTFTDGGFYAMGVKPGVYELAIDPRTLDALVATAVPLRLTLSPTPGGVAAEEPRQGVAERRLVVHPEHAELAAGRRGIRRHLRLGGFFALVAGQRDPEARPVPGLRLHPDATAVLAGDPVADGEPEARTDALGFGGKERVEDLAPDLGRDTGAGVGDLESGLALSGA